MVKKKQGETIEYVLRVLNNDGTPANLTGCRTYCGYVKQGEPDSSVVLVTPVIDLVNSKIIATLSHEATEAMLGKYLFELKVMDSFGKVAVELSDTITITDSIIPEFPDA